MHTLYYFWLVFWPSPFHVPNCAALSDIAFHALLWAVVSCNRRDLGVAASTIDLKWHCYFSWPNWVFKNYGISTETDFRGREWSPPGTVGLILSWSSLCIYHACFKALHNGNEFCLGFLFWFFFSLGISLGRERNVDISRIAPYSLMPLGLKNCWSKTTGCAETKCGGFLVSVVLHF